MSTIRENEKQVSVYFDSLLELMDYTPPDINQKRFDDYIGKSHHPGYDRKWYGPTNKTSKDVINHALLGDEELYQNLQSKINELDRAVGKYTTDYTQNIKKAQRKKYRSDFGDEIDIHKVYQGQCNVAWTKTKRVEVDQAHHLVSILVDYVGSSGENANDSLWRAAVAVKLVDDLLTAGKSVKLLCGSVCASAMEGSSKNLVTSVVIKNYNEHLSMPRLAAMTHLGFFRTAGFAMMCAQHRKAGYSLGYPQNLTYDNMPIHLKDDVEAGHTKYIPVGRISSLSSAIAGLNKAYELLRSFS